MKLLATLTALMLTTAQAFAQGWISETETDPFDGSETAFAVAGEGTLAISCDTNSIGISVFVIEPGATYNPEHEAFADYIEFAFAVDGEILNVKQTGSYIAENRNNNPMYGAYFDPADARTIMLAVNQAKGKIVTRVYDDAPTQRNNVSGSTKASETILACLNKQEPRQ